MNLDAKTGAAGTIVLAIVAAIGVGMGKVVWETPEGRQCAVDLSAAQVRVETLAEVRDRCEVLLDRCGGADASP